MCDIDYSRDLDSPQFWREEIRTARKQHYCGECLGIISPGTKYHNIGICYDRQVSTYKSCLDCNIVANLFSKEHGSYEVHGLHAQLTECIKDSVRNNDQDSLKRWAIPLRDMNRRTRKAKRNE